ncbi:substrate-binding periplasmic protein [Pseudoalteromonas fenneropenaei]|uniref:Substrate-binding periplasmic protein n=1 Tax=Pseudoalteromonas fenneropenaei TaxID=1737459 RepID=A0ABV7CG11_9GAMM
MSLTQYFRAKCAPLALLCSLLTASALATPLTVVTELSPPSQTMENGEVAGESTALVRMILAEAKLSGEFAMLPWARAFKNATTQKDTLIYSIARTSEREEQFEWIGPVALFELGFVTNRFRDDIQLKSLDDAKHLRIAVQRSDISAEILAKLGFDFIQTTDIEKSYALLINNKVDLVVDDPRFLVDMAKALKLPRDQFRFVLTVPELATQGYLAASKTTSKTAVEQLKTAFKQVSETSEYKQVMKQTILKD